MRHVYRQLNRVANLSAENVNLHAHVFAIDILPTKGTISTGGGIRSHQIIEGLRSRGFDVTYSVPRVTDFAKANWDCLTDEERRNSYSWEIGSTYEDIIGRLKPDVVLCLWPNVYTFPRYRREAPFIVYDLNGLQNVEQALTYIANGDKGTSLRRVTQSYLNKIVTADILLCGSLEQKAYWSGLLSFEFDLFTAPEIITIPYYPVVKPIHDAYNIGRPTFYCSGSFLPWNSPEGNLFAAATLIQKAGRGELWVIGKPNPEMSHASVVNRELAALRKFDFVTLKDYMPYPDFSALINNHGIGIDLNARTLERELAVPIRTVNYLAHGVPIITNNYSSISLQVSKYKAGWCVDPTSTSDFENTFDTVLKCSPSELKLMSTNARRLAHENFSPEDGFLELKRQLILNQKQKSQKTQMGISDCSDIRPCVLVISDECENLLSVRVYLPFDAMYKKGLIKGYHVLSSGSIVRSVGVPSNIGAIDAVWVQRVPRDNPLFILDMLAGCFVYDIDDNLLGAPNYRPKPSLEYRSLICALLRISKIVTTTSNRLTSSLQRLSGVQIEHKTIIAPNVSDKVEQTTRVKKLDGLAIVSSDHLPLTKSLSSFVNALKLFTESRRLPIIYIGTPVNDLSRLGLPVQSTGILGYDAYRDYIRQHDLMAVVPLEGHGDSETHNFISCKSDIKMVEFGSAGVPAVYANVPPYSESILNCGPLVDMWDSEAVVSSLENVYANSDRWRSRGYESVLTHRIAENVVADTWFHAIQRTRLNIPVDLSVFVERYRQYCKFRPELSGSIIDRGVKADFHQNKEWRPAHLWSLRPIADTRDPMLGLRQDVGHERLLAALETTEVHTLQADLKVTEHTAITPDIHSSLRKKIHIVAQKIALRFGVKNYPPLFDSKYYLEQYPDVRNSGLDPYLHYQIHGISERRNPNKYFNTHWYMEQNPDVGRDHIDPIEHYVQKGARQGLDPSPEFSTRDYLQRHPSLKEGGTNPLQHFLERCKIDGHLT